MDLATYWLWVPIIGMLASIPAWVWLVHDLMKRKHKEVHHG